MYSSSFGVALHGNKVVILGVCSIMPNMNGVLFQCANGVRYQYDHEQVNMTIDYASPEMDELPEGYEVWDYRS